MKIPNDSRTIRSIVINLERHHDRWLWVSRNFSDAGIAIERLDAVDASNPALHDEITRMIKPGSGLSLAEAACTLSHRKAWQALLETDEKYLAIFEDDVYISRDMRELLDPHAIKTTVDLIKLETPTGKISYQWKPESNLKNRRLHKILSKAYGAGGYIISRQCATRLISLTEQLNAPVDEILFDEKSQIWSEFNVVQLIPSACIQDNMFAKYNAKEPIFDSAIENERKIAGAIRKTIQHKTKNPFRLKKLRAYFQHVSQGANPFRHKTLIPLDLG